MAKLLSDYDREATEEMLYMILSQYIDDLEEVNLHHEEQLDYGGWFLDCMLFLGDGDSMEVPFVYYEGNEWLFTPCDWQGNLPKTANEISMIDWRVDDTEQEAVLYDGQPMLAPWAAEIRKEHDERQARRKALGRQLKEAREEAGLSIRQAEEETGISKNIISRTEAGRANTTIDTVMELCACYGKELSVEKRVPYFKDEDEMAEFLRRQRENEK